jgi:outer membrane protein OmpA-like peptidoglycan-associated protein
MTRRTTQAVLLVTALAFGLAGCETMTQTQKDTGKGAMIGAAAGAVLGAITGGGKDAGKGAVIGGAVGAVGGYIWSQKMQEQKAAMEKATQGTGVAVSQTADNRLKMDVPSDISFDVGRSTVKGDFSKVLDQFAAGLVKNPDTTVTIVGHTDSTGNDGINNPLSVDRANSTRDYLIAKGVAATRFNTEGRGSREPVADNTSADGRAKNRRVEIFIGEPAKVAQK